MRPAQAIKELEGLKAEAANPADIRPGEKSGAWKAKVRAVMTRSLGPDNDLIRKFDGVRYSPMIFSDATPRSTFDKAFASGVLKARGLIDAAIYELRLMGGDEPIDEHAYDPDLWAHVKQQVEDEDWGKVASQTAIFVESHVRAWAGHPKDSKVTNWSARACGRKS
jgi:hypothetical protein